MDPYSDLMITAVHTLIYSDDPAATRRFFREVLELTWVSDKDSSDEGSNPRGDDSWLIFDTGPSELAVHPTRTETPDGEVFNAPRHHQISLMVEDIEACAATIRERGAQIIAGPSDFGWGVGMEVAVPGTDAIMIYQPTHATAYHL